VFHSISKHCLCWDNLSGVWDRFLPAVSGLRIVLRNRQTSVKQIGADANRFSGSMSEILGLLISSELKISSDIGLI
jgi:hypothetical protein